MIKLEDIKVGITVYHKNDINFKKPYTIINTNCVMKTTEWHNCIIYKPEYNNSYDCFVRDIDSFMTNFSLKPHYTHTAYHE